MGPNHARPSAMKRYLGAHYGSYNPADTPHAAWRAYLRFTTSSPSMNIAELELSWLAGLGFSTGTLTDRWGAYIAANGYGGGYFPEKLRQYFEQF